ncbi:site-specific integrase [Deinococcus rubellus]
MTKRGNGQGSVRKLPSGRFRWELMIEGRRFSGMAASKTLAQQALAGLIADATRGGIADPSTVTVTEYLTQWLEGRKTSRAYRTHEVQERALRLYIRPAIGEKRLQKLSPADLRALFDSLNKKDLGAASQRQVHQLLLTSLKHALQLEIVTRNVAEIVRPNPPRKRESEELAAFTPNEAASFLAACRADPHGAWFEFALGTGMRRGEVCGLKWADLNLKAKTVAVRETISDTGGTIRISAPKTVNSRRTVHLSGETLELLSRHRERQAMTAEAIEGWADSGRIFTNLHGGTLRPNNLRRDMTRLCEAAGVRFLPIHGLRHTYASLSLQRGIPVEVVSKQLGHSTVAFTLSQYRTVYQGEREGWALGLGDMLEGKTG